MNRSREEISKQIQNRASRLERRHNQTLNNPHSTQRRLRRQSLGNMSDNEDNGGRRDNIPDNDNNANRDGQANLDGLSEAQIRQVQDFIARQLAANQPPAPVIQVRQINTTIDIPQYDSRKTNTSTYYTNLKKYFDAQGYDEVNYHNYLGGVLKGEFKYWYEAHSNEIKSWRDFKTAFSSKYDNEEISRNRCKSFYSRKQRLVDPCEQFVYEMAALGKQVVEDPSDISLILATVRDALHPEIGLTIQDWDLISIDKFLNRVAIVHNNIIRQSHMHNRKKVEIPPLKGNRDELVKQKLNNPSNREENFRGRGRFRSSFQGSRGFNHSQHRKSNDSNQAFDKNDTSYYRNSDSNYYSERGNSSNNSQPSNHNQRNESNTQSDSGRGKAGLSSIQCWNCGRVGHMERNCPGHNVLLSMHGSDEQQGPDNEWEEYHNMEEGPNCWKCNRIGHIKRNCPENDFVNRDGFSNKSQHSFNAEDEWDEYQYSEEGPECWECGKIGHIRRNCRNDNSFVNRNEHNNDAQ